MALLKKELVPNSGEINADLTPDERKSQVVQQLSDPDPYKRRLAAGELASYPDQLKTLIERLQVEEEQYVCEGIFNTLLHFDSEETVGALIPLLRSDDAALRNGVIEVLQGLPNAVAPYMQELLTDEDSDVRIFAIDILQVLEHPDTPAWLLDVIKTERHINVLGTAVDRLAEVGTLDMVDELRVLKSEWPDESFLGFAVDAAIQRIQGE